ncbi:MAG: MFS transporter [Hyphomicrobiaceae bacterium]|nr:MFS transporter [Hyphomicrobiaceae bacterium]
MIHHEAFSWRFEASSFDFAEGWVHLMGCSCSPHGMERNEMQLTLARAALPAVLLGAATSLVNFDVTAVIVAAGDIAHDLGFGVRGLAWVMDAYSIAFVAALLSSGAMADRFGRRLVLLAGNGVFAIASVACAAALSGEMLWAARALQGVGAAGIVTGGIALIAAAYPETGARARALGLFGVLSGVAMALGPTLGGLITQYLGWRWIFLVNIPVCLAVGIWLPRLVPEVREFGQRRIDVPAVCLLTVSLGFLIMGLLEAPASPTSGAIEIGIGTAKLIAFAFQQRSAASPLLDARYLAAPAGIGVGVLLVVASLSYWAVLVILPAILRETFAWTASEIGWGLLLATLPMLLLPVPAARLVVHWGWRRHFALGVALIAVGDLAVASMPLVPSRDAALVAVVIGMVVMGAGAALVQAQLSGALVTLAPTECAGMASAATIVFRQGGFAIGIAALGALSLSAASPHGHARAMLFAAVCAGAASGVALWLLPGEVPGGGRSGGAEGETRH